MYHSEYHQDEFVAELLGHKQGGTFVEFGALDGLLHSNSLYFERELGWTGLLIEANPIAFVELAKRRPNAMVMNMAVSDCVNTVRFKRIYGGLRGWSGLWEIDPIHEARIKQYVQEGEITDMAIPAMPLDRLLRQFNLSDIDYMSIDVEGAEEMILSVFPFADFNIDVLGVEDNFGNPRLDEIIRAGGYQFLQKVGPDRMYRRIT